VLSFCLYIFEISFVLASSLFITQYLFKHFSYFVILNSWTVSFLARAQAEKWNAHPVMSGRPIAHKFASRLRYLRNSLQSSLAGLRCYFSAGEAVVTECCVQIFYRNYLNRKYIMTSEFVCVWHSRLSFLSSCKIRRSHSFVSENIKLCKTVVSADYVLKRIMAWGWKYRNEESIWA
jgi:hypothetical protein